MNESISQLKGSSLEDLKAAYTTRHVNFENSMTLLSGGISPKPGDVALAKVEKIGHHTRLELCNGRRARLFKGENILVCYGNRYAPDQFEAVVPERLCSSHMAAAGGIIARVLSRHGKMKKPTVLHPLGILGDHQGRRLNLSDFALTNIQTNRHRPLTIVVMGTAMNSGKTTTAANLIKGLVNSGLKVGAAKVTGTGAGGDIWFMRDAGAHPVLDFVDAGYASTYKVSSKQTTEILEILMNHLTQTGVEAVVLEFADGLFQDEIADLLCASAFSENVCKPIFNSYVDGLIFAAHDAMGADAGTKRLRQSGLPVMALSGTITQSPLAVREAMEATGLPVLDSQTLGNPEIARVMERLLSHYQTRSLKAA